MDEERDGQRVKQTKRKTDQRYTDKERDGRIDIRAKRKIQAKSKINKEKVGPEIYGQRERYG